MSGIDSGWVELTADDGHRFRAYRAAAKGAAQ